MFEKYWANRIRYYTSEVHLRGLCQQFCINDTGCIAYTYVRPRPQGLSAVCYLKSVAPASNPDDCCVSGVKL